MKLRAALALAALAASCGWRLPDPAPWEPPDDDAAPKEDAVVDDLDDAHDAARDAADADATDVPTADLAPDLPTDATMDAVDAADAVDAVDAVVDDLAQDAALEAAVDAADATVDAADAATEAATDVPGDSAIDAADATADRPTDAPPEAAADATGDVAHDAAGDVGVEVGADVPVDPTDAALPSLRFQSLSLGFEHSCGVTVANDLYCWGNNDSGQLGDGTLVSRSVATRVLAGIPVLEVSCGRAHTCARTTANNLYCWGNNDSGQLGDGTRTGHSLPAQVRDLDRYVLGVAVGSDFSCVVGNDRTARCWGLNDDGQLGDGSNTTRTRQAYVAGPTAVTAVLAGDRHACVLNRERVSCGSTSAEAAVLRCWGANDHGQLGDGSYMQRRYSVAVSALNSSCASAEFPSLGGDHTCARSGASLYCFGANDRGQLGTGDRADQTLPVAVFEAGVFGVNYIPSLGDAHTCARRDDGALRCTGGNDHGELATGDRTERLNLTPMLSAGAPIAAVYAGGAHTCLVGVGGEAYCVGRNDSGQLGTGDLRDRVRPVRITP